MCHVKTMLTHCVFLTLNFRRSHPPAALPLSTVAHLVHKVPVARSRGTRIWAQLAKLLQWLLSSSVCPGHGVLNSCFLSMHPLIYPLLSTRSYLYMQINARQWPAALRKIPSSPF